MLSDICFDTVKAHFYNTKSQGVGCLDRNLYSAVPPIPNSKVGVDVILCYLMYLDCKLLRRRTFSYSQFVH